MPLISRILCFGVAAFLLVGILNSPTSAKDDDEVGYLGVYLEDLDEELRESIDYEGDGAFIDNVVEDSPAEEAGIKAGDVIIKFGKKEVTDASDLRRFVRATYPGEKVKIELIRNGKKKRVTAEIGELEDYESHSFSFKFDCDNFGDAFKHFFFTPKTKYHFHCSDRGFLGVNIQDFGEQLAEYFGVKNGALVTSVVENSPAEKTGIKAGDVIVEFRSREVEDCDDLRYLISKTDPDDEVDVKVIRNREEMTFTTKLDKSPKKCLEKKFKSHSGTKKIYKYHLKDLEKLKELEELKGLKKLKKLEGLEVNLEGLDKNLSDIDIQLNLQLDDLDDILDDIMDDMEIEFRPMLPD